MIEVFNLEGKAIFKDRADDDYSSCLARVYDKNCFNPKYVSKN